MQNELVRRYPPVVELEENDGKVYYRASFRDFPDVIGGIGDTVEEAIEEAYGLLEAEILFRSEEGMSIPDPIVKPLTGQASGRVTLRMSKTLHQQAIEASEEDGVSLNSLINEALGFWLGARRFSDFVADFSSAHFSRPLEQPDLYFEQKQQFNEPNLTFVPVGSSNTKSA